MGSDEVLQDTYSKFSSLLYQYVFVEKALRVVSPEQLLSGTKPIKLSSILIQRLNANITKEDIEAYLRKLTKSSSNAVVHFLALYACAEGILSAFPPKRQPWKLPNNFERPKRFFSNLTFEDYLSVSDAVLWEISATRDEWMHNAGKKGADYMRAQRKRFPILQEQLGKLPAFFFVDVLRKRLELPEGASLTVSLEYFCGAEVFMFDRIMLKSGYFANFFRREEPDPNARELRLLDFKLEPVFE